MNISHEELLLVLRRAIQEAGSQKEFAQRHGISEQYISDVLRGRREPGRKVLDVLGNERAVLYRKTGGTQ